jgi:hypothetical protein
MLAKMGRCEDPCRQIIFLSLSFAIHETSFLQYFFAGACNAGMKLGNISVGPQYLNN